MTVTASPPSTASAERGLDSQAVLAARRRLARAEEAPWLHREVARRMAERLALFKLDPPLLIDWSSWLGGGATLLAEAFPQAQRVLVEPDAALLSRSRAAARSPWWSARRWTGSAAVVQDADDPLPQDARLLWANMHLHTELDPPALFARWSRALAIDGVVMFSCLGPGTLRDLRALYARLGWGEATPAFVDMHDLGDMLVEAGFVDPVMDQETLTLHWADAAALLLELRSLGANAAPGRHPGLRTPRWKARLLEQLSTLARDGRGPSLQFEVAYGHAFKGRPRARVGEETRVSLADMRAMTRGRGSGSLR